MKTRTICSALSLVALATAPLAAHASELLMPMRGDSLPNQSVFTTSGHSGYQCGILDLPADRFCALDILATRWDAQTQSWTDAPWPGGGSPDPETNTVAFGASVYSPVDGEIVACWREMPDDDISGDDVRCPGGGENPDATPRHQCARRGNHLLILTDDDELVGLNHLQQGSIPEELCPISTQYLYTDDDTSCGFYDDARLPNPIPVQKGDYVGGFGSTGASGKPHLHLTLSEAYIDDSGPEDVLCRGDQLPIEFSESWYAPLGNDKIDPNAWTPLTDDRLPINGTVYALFPDPIGVRTDTIVLEDGTLPALAATSSGGVVAFRDSTGRLSTIAYGFNGAGEFLLGPEDSAGSVSDIAVAKIGASSRHVVVAVRNGNGRLQLKPYHVASNRTLTPGNSVTLGKTSNVDVTRAPNHQGVLAARVNGSGKVTVTDFSSSVSGTSVSLTKRGGASTNASAKAVAVDRIVQGRGLNENSGGFEGAITAERRSDDRLAVRSWSVTPQGTVVLEDALLLSHRGAAVYVEDVDISVVGESNGREVAVVSARQRTTDDLHVFTIEVSASGQLSKLGGYEAGPVNALASGPAGPGDVLLGVASALNNLIELAFSVGSDSDPLGTGNVRRTGTRRFDATSDVAVGVRAGKGDSVFAVRNGGDEIQLIRHRVNFSQSR
jgi:hypothetical protein